MDILGHALKTYADTGDEQIIDVSSDVSLVEELAASYFYRTFDEMTPMEMWAMEHAWGRVLDIGAGAGCHSVHLGQNGLQVTALERSPLLCQLLGERGVTDVIESDLYSWPTQGRTYDTILLLMNGAGLAGTVEGLDRLIGTLAPLLSDDGQILMDSSDISELYVDDEGATLIDLSKAHQEDITYHLEWNGLVEEFAWTFPDEQMIEAAALRCGLVTDKVLEDDKSFLIRLMRAEED